MPLLTFCAEPLQCRLMTNISGYIQEICWIPLDFLQFQWIFPWQIHSPLACFVFFFGGTGGNTAPRGGTHLLWTHCLWATWGHAKAPPEPSIDITTRYKGRFFGSVCWFCIHFFGGFFFLLEDILYNLVFASFASVFCGTSYSHRWQGKRRWPTGRATCALRTSVGSCESAKLPSSEVWSFTGWVMLVKGLDMYTYDLCWLSHVVSHVGWVMLVTADLGKTVAIFSLLLFSQLVCLFVYVRKVDFWLN